MTNPYWVDDSGILHGPKVIVMLLPEASTQVSIAPKSIILHSNAGPAKTSPVDLWRYMNRTDVTGEAHLDPAMDGTIYQFMPFTKRADCNAQANAWAISFETQDNGSGSLPTTEWTPEQFSAMAGAIAAISVKYNIPITLPTNWRGAGVGYHSQYPEWSIYVGKTCPGAARIRQMPALLQAATRLTVPEEDPIMHVFQKSGHAACWLADGRTRIHLPTMEDLWKAVDKYGPIITLPATDNLDGIGIQIVTNTADI